MKRSLMMGLDTSLMRSFSVKRRCIQPNFTGDSRNGKNLNTSLSVLSFQIMPMIFISYLIPETCFSYQLFFCDIFSVQFYYISCCCFPTDMQVQLNQPSTPVCCHNPHTPLYHMVQCLSRFAFTQGPWVEFFTNGHLIFDSTSMNKK